MSVRNHAGVLLLAGLAAMTLGASWLAPQPGERQDARWQNAPPTAIHLRDDRGAWHAPFIHRLVRVSQLEQRYRHDSSVVPLKWFSDGHLVQSSDSAGAPLLLLGADSLGRDVFSRLLLGARISLLLSALSTVLALVLGALLGGIAGYRGGLTDDVLMRSADVVVLLPGIYVALMLRALLPAVATPTEVFAGLAVIFAVMGAPVVARGMRGVVRAERAADYVAAARALGAPTTRIVVRHIIPSTWGFLGVQATMLLPAFIVAETTFSYVGLGFPDTLPTWGTMLLEASSARAFADFPWLLAPVVALFLVVLALHVAVRRPETEREHRMAF